jgi:hypothetical protein
MKQSTHQRPTNKAICQRSTGEATHRTASPRPPARGRRVWGAGAGGTASTLKPSTKRSTSPGRTADVTSFPEPASTSRETYRYRAGRSARGAGCARAPAEARAEAPGQARAKSSCRRGGAHPLDHVRRIWRHLSERGTRRVSEPRPDRGARGAARMARPGGLRARGPLGGRTWRPTVQRPGPSIGARSSRIPMDGGTAGAILACAAGAGKGRCGKEERGPSTKRDSGFPAPSGGVRGAECARGVIP